MKGSIMKWICILAFCCSVNVFAHSKAGDAVFVDTKNIKWTEVPGFKGISTFTADGDAAKGPHHTFMKFSAGFSAPVHHHTADHFVSVISGTLVLTVDGQEHRLPAGSYFAFKNKHAHATACAADSDCVIFLDVRGKWDVVMPVKK
jgi:quercetin dioxygenase-like cupin family protein